MLFDDVKLQPQKGWFQSLKCLISEDFSTPAASVFLRATEKITNEHECSFHRFSSPFHRVVSAPDRFDSYHPVNPV
jgi:hypothetical protein